MVAVIGGVLASATVARAESCVALPPDDRSDDRSGRRGGPGPVNERSGSLHPARRRPRLASGGLRGRHDVDRARCGFQCVGLRRGPVHAGRRLRRGERPDTRGRGSETCVVSVGEVVRSDCLVKVTVDDLMSPPPTPTVPPVPTVPPTPEGRPHARIHPARRVSTAGRDDLGWPPGVPAGDRPAGAGPRRRAQRHRDHAAARRDLRRA